jgi:hypothetical protein
MLNITHRQTTSHHP